MPTAIFAAISAASLTTALISFAISYVVGLIFAPDEPEAPADQGVQARIPTNPKNKLPVVYGEQRIAGQTVMADITSDNQKMAFIIALCEGPVESITKVTWEDKVLTFGSEDISTGLRSVSTATDEDGDTSSFLNGNLKCRVYPEGGACPEMSAFSTRWDKNKQNRLMLNTAYAYIELKYDRDERVTGLPSSLFFHVKGRTVDKLQSDGSLNSSTTMSTNPIDNLVDFLTNESYGCSIPKSGLNFPSFYAHKLFCDRLLESTANNFCRFDTVNVANATTVANGMQSSTGSYDDDDYVPSDLADASVFNNKRDCNEATAFDGSASVSGTWQDASNGVLTVEKPRYSTNGVLDTNNQLDTNISDLTVGNGGIFTYNLGKFGIISEGTRDVATRGTTNVHFSENNIIGKLDITGSGFDAVLNECTLKFTSIKQKYLEEQVRIAYDQINSPLPNTIQNPNEPRLEKTMNLPFTSNDVEARRIGRILVNDSRQALIINFRANIDNTDLQAGDIFEISHKTPGWTNKKFRIQQVDEQIIDQENNSVGVSIIAREYAPEVYTAEMLLLADPAPNTKLANPLVVPELNLTAVDPIADPVSTVINGVPTSQIRVNWNNSPFLATVEVRYIIGNRPAGNPVIDTPRTTPLTNSTPISELLDSDWTNTSFDGTQASGILTNLEPESIYQIQARPRNTLGAQGSFGPIGAGKITATTVPLESIFEIDVNVSSNTGGNTFKNGALSTEKELTATVTKVTEIDADLADHKTFKYLWTQDGSVVCIDSSKNAVGVAAIDLSFNGPKTFTQTQCESAGGTFTAGSPVGSNNVCTIGGSDIGSALGCAIGFRADTTKTGFTITDDEKLRKITVQYDDVDNVVAASESSEFSCDVSNITLT